MLSNWLTCHSHTVLNHLFSKPVWRDLRSTWFWFTKQPKALNWRNLKYYFPLSFKLDLSSSNDIIISSFVQWRPWINFMWCALCLKAIIYLFSMSLSVATLLSTCKVLNCCVKIQNKNVECLLSYFFYVNLKTYTKWWCNKSHFSFFHQGL